MRKIVIFSVFIAGLLTLSGCVEKKMFVRMADSEMIRNPQSWMVDFSKDL